VNPIDSVAKCVGASHNRAVNVLGAPYGSFECFFFGGLIAPKMALLILQTAATIAAIISTQFHRIHDHHNASGREHR